MIFPDEITVALSQSNTAFLEACNELTRDVETERFPFKVEVFSSSGKVKLPVVENLAGLTCYNCETVFTSQMVASIWMGDEVRCSSCSKATHSYVRQGGRGKGLGGSNWKVSMCTSEAALLVEAENVSRTRWFHATVRENWLESAQLAGANVHVGSLKSALMRAWHMCQNTRNDIVYVHEVEMGAVSLHPYTYLDENRWVGRLPASVTRLTQGTPAALRYVNVWEGVGDVSLFLNAESLRVVDSDIMILNFGDRI